MQVKKEKAFDLGMSHKPIARFSYARSFK